jgi:AraC-like DNA-binding protein
MILPTFERILLFYKKNDNLLFMSVRDYYHQINTLEDPQLPCIVNFQRYMPGQGFISVHWHDELEILRIVSGNGKILNNMETLESKPGDSVIVNTDTLHNIVNLSSTLELEMVMINKDFLLKNQIDLDNLSFPSLVHDDKVNDSIHSILQEEAGKGRYYKPLIRSKIIDLMVYLCRNYGKSRNVTVTKNDQLDRKFFYTKKAIIFIQKNYQRHFFIEEICNTIGLSKYYLCHSFKTVTGKTLVEYINIIRCEHARELLASGNFNVGESAEQCGFQDISYFSRIYKKYMGILPSEEKVPENRVNQPGNISSGKLC